MLQRVQAYFLLPFGLRQVRIHEDIAVSQFLAGYGLN